MAKKKVSISDDKITVIVQDKYDVYEKPIPPDADPEVNWLGNFGISEKQTGKKLNGKVPKYEIQIPNVEGKNLVYWADSMKKAVPGQKTVAKNKNKYRIGELDLGDPAVGWDR